MLECCCLVTLPCATLEGTPRRPLVNVSPVSRFTVSLKSGNSPTEKQSPSLAPHAARRPTVTLSLSPSNRTSGRGCDSGSIVVPRAAPSLSMSTEASGQVACTGRCRMTSFPHSSSIISASTVASNCKSCNACALAAASAVSSHCTVCFVAPWRWSSSPSASGELLIPVALGGLLPLLPSLH